ARAAFASPGSSSNSAPGSVAAPEEPPSPLLISARCTSANGNSKKHASSRSTKTAWTGEGGDEGALGRGDWGSAGSRICRHRCRPLCSPGERGRQASSGSPNEDP